jgi:hypothetical protein
MGRRGAVRFFAIGLTFLAGVATTPLPAVAAQLDCLMIDYQDPNTHEKFYITTAPLPIREQIETPANGESKPVSGKCVDALLRGEIISGDYEKIRKALRDSWPYLAEIRLNSPGGSVLEALNIGRLLRKYLITTTAYVPSWEKQPDQAVPQYTQDLVCASACALIWFGGVERMGHVGLHRPRIDDPDFANRPPDEATALYRRVLSEIEGYLVEMEIPRPTIDIMLATSSADVRWVDAKTDGLSRPPSYAEWEDASCRENANPFCRSLLRSSRVKQLSPP